MILVLFVALAAATVPLAHGHLTKLADLRFRRGWLLLMAVLLQLGLALVEGGRSTPRDVIHVVSYLFAVGFLVENRRIPGMWLIALGTSLNLTAILANGGVMPASPHALASAGLPVHDMFTHFSNSMALPSPKLSFLGDIFAIPKSVPLSNVFSVGDVCVAAGAVVTLHRVAESSLIPSGRGQFAPLMRRPTFMRLWGSQAVSNLGDWTYALALAYTLVHRTHNPSTFAMLLVCQVAPAALFGGLLGALADRHSRIKLMIGADVLRAVAVGTLLLGHPSVPHIYLVAAVLGICGAIFQPSLQASIPNVVESDQVVAANAMVGATYHFAIMAGPALGGLLVESLGATPMFALNAISFVLSAVLIAGIKLPHPKRSESPDRTAMRDLKEGARYAVTTPLVRTLLIVIGLVLVAAASKAPLESLFVLNTLDLGPQALGLVLGCWGLGMLLGSIAAPAVCRRWVRERVLVFGIAVVGVCVLFASQAHDLETVLLAWLLAGTANSVANVSYESVLQERTPDEYRGRVFAAFEVVTNAAFLTGAFLAGWLGNHLGVRMSYVFSGLLFLAGAGVAATMLWNSRHAVRVLVGFDRRAAAAQPVEPLPITSTAMAGPAHAASSHPELQPAFAAGDSVFASGESVFAQAEREAKGEFVERRPVTAAPVWAAPQPQPEGLQPVPFDWDEVDEIIDDEVADPVIAAPSEPVLTPFEPALTPAWSSDVEDLSSSFDPADRLRAIEIAAQNAGDPLVGTIVKALGDPEAPVRRRAAEELGRLGIREAIPALDHAIEDPDESVRAAALDALSSMQDDAILSAIVDALKDDSAEVRSAAAAELLRRRSPDVVRMLGDALSSSALRGPALEVLTEMGPVAVDPIVDMLASANGFRPALGAALSRVCDPEHFVDQLSVLDPTRRRRAVEALAGLGRAHDVARGLVDPEPEIRARAAELLGELGEEGVREDLQRATFDPVPEVGNAAHRAIERMDDARELSAVS